MLYLVVKLHKNYLLANILKAEPLFSDNIKRFLKPVIVFFKISIRSGYQKDKNVSQWLTQSFKVDLCHICSSEAQKIYLFNPILRQSMTGFAKNSTFDPKISLYLFYNPNSILRPSMDDWFWQNLASGL